MSFSNVIKLSSIVLLILIAYTVIEHFTVIEQNKQNTVYNEYLKSSSKEDRSNKASNVFRYQNHYEKDILENALVNEYGIKKPQHKKEDAHEPHPYKKEAKKELESIKGLQINTSDLLSQLKTGTLENIKIYNKTTRKDWSFVISPKISECSEDKNVCLYSLKDKENDAILFLSFNQNNQKISGKVLDTEFLDTYYLYAEKERGVFYQHQRQEKEIRESLLQKMVSII